MNRRKLEQHLRAHGCAYYRAGGRHDIWINTVTLAQAPIPRHNILKRGTARSICRMLGVKLPSEL